jgi:hypothetical protein
LSKENKAKCSIRKTVVISKEQDDWLKTLVVRMSSSEKRTITISEAIRMAIEAAYPVPKNQYDFVERKNV